MTFNVEAARRFTEHFPPHEEGSPVSLVIRDVLAACDEIERERKRVATGRAALLDAEREIERLRAEVAEWRDDAELKQSTEVTRLRSLLAEAIEGLEAALPTLAQGERAMSELNWTRVDVLAAHRIRTALARLKEQV